MLKWYNETDLTQTVKMNELFLPVGLASEVQIEVQILLRIQY